MSTGYGEGEGRVQKAIEDALNSPLLNDNDIFNSKKILLSINFCNEKDANNGLMMEEMNDINDFMAKFGKDFEIKWGLGTLPDLGNKVKITILATGFGLRDVEVMSSHLNKKYTQEEASRIAEIEEKKAEKMERMKEYYGETNTSGYSKRAKHIYLFRPEDLDNEDVIYAVETTPTYKRSKKTVNDIRNQADGQKPNEDETSDNSEPVQGIISFA